MRWGVSHSCSYPIETIEETNWGWDPTNSRANGEKKEDIKDIAQYNLGLSSVLCNANILLTLPVEMGGFVCWMQRGTTKCTDFFLIIRPLSFHVSMSLTAGCDPQGGCVMGVLQGSRPGIWWRGKPCQIYHTKHGKQDANQEPWKLLWG